MNGDQNMAQLRDTLPPMWWAIYQGCMQTGFSERQAFAIVQTVILSQNPHGIRPADNTQPPPQDYT